MTWLLVVLGVVYDLFCRRITVRCALFTDLEAADQSGISNWPT